MTKMGLLDKQPEIYFSGAESRAAARAKAQALRRFSRQNWVRLLLWGFGRNGACSVALQGVMQELFCYSSLSKKPDRASMGYRGKRTAET
jgi:hypothetical protein